MLSLTSPLTAVAGIGPALAQRLKRLGLNCVQDLLLHFPSRYEDFSKCVPIADLRTGEQVTVRGRVQLMSSRRARGRRLTITEALLSDGSGTVKAIWFNLPYLTKSIKVGDEVALAGKLQSSRYGLQLEHPVLELMEKQGLHTGRLVPFYPLTSPLTHRQLRTLVSRALPLARQLKDWLPHEIMRPAALLPLPQTVAELHFPSSPALLKQARRRVTFDELFITHLKSRLARRRLSTRQSAAIPFAPQTKALVQQLPWALTQDQRACAWTILQDLGRTQPMLRLLQGDVGSGKTIVAGLACFNVAQAGYQTALLAPTELLAEQHYRTLTKLFKGWPIQVGLLTRGYHELSHGPTNVTAATVKAQAAKGTIQILIGTQALLQASVKLPRLGLVVVDEQHRFGVQERQALIETSGITPHLLSLSATPIPRSLALTVYGDLDLSLIQSLPAGRRPITTRLVPPTNRQSAYDLMRSQVAKASRVFIVCPLIEESDSLGVRAATAEHERLSREIFPELKLGLLHGKLTSRDKAKAMKKVPDRRNSNSGFNLCG